MKFYIKDGYHGGMYLDISAFKFRDKYRIVHLPWKSKYMIEKRWRLFGLFPLWWQYAISIKTTVTDDLYRDGFFDSFDDAKLFLMTAKLKLYERRQTYTVLLTDTL